MSSDLGDRTNHRRRPLDRGRGFKSGETHFSHDGTNITFLQEVHKTEGKNKGSEQNKKFDPGGKGGKPPPWNAAVILSFLFLRGAVGHGRPAVCTSCFLSVCFVFFFCPPCSVLQFYDQVTIFSAS